MFIVPNGWRKPKKPLSNPRITREQTCSSCGNKKMWRPRSAKGQYLYKCTICQHKVIK